MKIIRAFSATSKGVLIACFVASLGQAAQTNGKPQPQKPGYATIEPVIQRRCYGCHNDVRPPQKVDLTSYESLMKSGDHGPIVIAGHPEKSKLLLYIDGTKKPRMPINSSPLEKKDMAAIRAWIAAGAHK